MKTGKVYDIRTHMRARKRRRVHADRLRAISSEFLLAEKRERRRIATALNESVAQVLAVSKMKLCTLGVRADTPEFVKTLEEVRGLIESAIREIRALAFEISPPVLYEMGLEPAIEWLVEHMDGQGIRIRFEDDRQTKPMNEAFRVLLFQATREVLAGIVRHSEARNAKVSVRRNRDKVQISIEDDGVGFRTLADLDRPGGGGGIFPVFECLNHIGGYFEIESDSDRGGTRITLILPLEEDRGEKDDDTNKEKAIS